MPVPTSVLLVIGKFAFDEYQKYRERGDKELTDAEWLEFETEILTRRKEAWDRFDSA